jgi:hypothetical protein
VVAVREDECVHRLTGGSFSKGFDFHAGWGCSARPVHSEQRRGRESVAEGRVNCKARSCGFTSAARDRRLGIFAPFRDPSFPMQAWRKNWFSRGARAVCSAPARAGVNLRRA